MWQKALVGGGSGGSNVEVSYTMCDDTTNLTITNDYTKAIVIAQRNSTPSIKLNGVVQTFTLIASSNVYRSEFNVKNGDVISQAYGIFDMLILMKVV